MCAVPDIGDAPRPVSVHRKRYVDGEDVGAVSDDEAWVERNGVARTPKAIAAADAVPGRNSFDPPAEGDYNPAEVWNWTGKATRARYWSATDMNSSPGLRRNVYTPLIFRGLNKYTPEK